MQLAKGKWFHIADSDDELVPETLAVFMRTWNDIPDESEEFIDLNIDEDAYIPAVHLYYNDDLTVA